MTQYVKDQLILNWPVPGGGTQRDHLKAARPNDPRLKQPAFDEFDLYILAVFQQLSKDRVPVMEGIAPISLQSFVNYSTLFDDKLDPNEIILIQQVDQTYISTILEMRK